ncbi:hypothetical protein AB0L80_38605 [Streptomyces sp. NPDC052069]
MASTVEARWQPADRITDPGDSGRPDQVSGCPVGAVLLVLDPGTSSR